MIYSNLRQIIVTALNACHTQEFKLKADRRSVIIRAVGFTVKIVRERFCDFRVSKQK